MTKGQNEYPIFRVSYKLFLRFSLPPSVLRCLSVPIEKRKVASLKGRIVLTCTPILSEKFAIFRTHGLGIVLSLNFKYGTTLIR